jgi:protein-disulfide isomerase
MKLGPITCASSLALVTAACGGAPSPIDRELAKTPEGQVTIVEFVDYRCTHCQTMFDVLAPLLDRNEGRVRLVVKHVPLEKHPGAREAAQIAICAEEQDKLEPVHEALMRGASTRDDDALTLAQTAGLDLERFKECRRGGLPRQRLSEDGTAWEEAGGDGLPMVFIGKSKFVGVTDIAALEEAFDAAK